MFKQLIEVGRKISKANREKLHAAMEKLRELIDQAVATDAEATEADRSYNDKEKLLRAAIRAKVRKPTDTYEPYCYIQDLFDTWCVFSHEDAMFKIDYVVGPDGAVTLGEPKAVIPRTVYEDAPVSEAEYDLDIVGDTILLQEAADAPAGINLVEAVGGRIKLIAPGWGSSGYYSEAMLKRDGPQVFKAGTHMYWDHPTAAEEAARPENSLTKLAAVIKADAAYDDQGPKGPGLYAPVDVFEQYKPAVKEMAPYIGVSIRAAGTAKSGEADGRKGPIIEKISVGKSVDFVTRAGAGGQIVSLFEAAGRGPAAEPTPNTKQEHEMTEAEIKALVEAEVKPLRDENAASKAEAARLRETLAVRDAAVFAERKLATIDLPKATKQRLVEALPKQATLKDGALDETAFTAVIEAAVQVEAEYLKSVGIGAGRITGMGSGRTEPETVKPEAIAAKFQALGMSEAAARYASEGRAA